jgi:hypothetical protein
MECHNKNIDLTFKRTQTEKFATLSQLPLKLQPLSDSVSDPNPVQLTTRSLKSQPFKRDIYPLIDGKNQYDNAHEISCS